MSGHPVIIDDDLIGASFADADGAPAPDAPDAEEVEVEAQPPNPDVWRKPCEIAAAAIAKKLCPNWDVDLETQRQLADALAECADQLMPGGIGNVDQWGPWGKLAFAAAGFALCGFDVETFSFKSPRVKVVPSGSAPEATPAQSTGTFSTAG